MGFLIVLEYKASLFAVVKSRRNSHKAMRCKKGAGVLQISIEAIHLLRENDAANRIGQGRSEMSIEFVPINAPQPDAFSSDFHSAQHPVLLCQTPAIQHTYPNVPFGGTQFAIDSSLFTRKRLIDGQARFANPDPRERARRGHARS
jgi:hypothetical protein